MICIIDRCNKPASATISYDVLDVSSTENVWVTTEPVYKKVSKAYCKKHFASQIENLHTTNFNENKQ